MIQPSNPGATKAPNHLPKNKAIDPSKPVAPTATPVLQLPRRYKEKEAADILHMSVHTLRHKRRDGLIGYHLENRSIYYDDEQLLEYNNRTKVEPAYKKKIDAALVWLLHLVGLWDWFGFA